MWALVRNKKRETSHSAAPTSIESEVGVGEPQIKVKLKKN